MENKELIAQVEKAYELLQGMDIKSTKANVDALMYTMLVLENVHKKLAEPAEEQPESGNN